MLGAVITFSIGVLLATVNYYLSRYIMRNSTKGLAPFSFLRQLINIGYMVLLFLVADSLPWDIMPVIVGGALGITLPIFFFTKKLIAEAELDSPTDKTDNSSECESEEVSKSEEVSQ